MFSLTHMDYGLPFWRSRSNRKLFNTDAYVFEIT
ncbi:hypothetical protein TSAR_008615 [Trichomalopsis sarcophagae]|uniref:Uncharacterized protein n=1 Tax=Trichomalopsis sarcophagae TaxID=543379 RepID=A0A232EIA4_9HYME|nr:hypothetical protein TSAR_008615 [Trichomalopsis sarcophagae]